MKKILFTFALSMTLALSPFAQSAQAWVGVRIGIGVPLYVGPGPYYYGYGYPYYYPPAYVVPPATVYQVVPPVAPAAPPAPSYLLPPPATVTPTPPASANNTAPAPYVPPAPPASTTPTIPTSGVIPASIKTTPQTDALVRQLSDPTDTVRRDAAVELGRLKALSALDALTNVLQKDASPIARDGAARGLGLIASSQSLRALIYAAQADNDRDVRHSAQFAVEAIRTNLRGN